MENAGGGKKSKRKTAKKKRRGKSKANRVCDKRPLDRHLGPCRWGWEQNALLGEEDTESK